MAIGIPVGYQDYPGFVTAPQPYSEWTSQGMASPQVLAPPSGPPDNVSGGGWYVPDRFKRGNLTASRADQGAMNPLMTFRDMGVPQDEPPAPMIEPDGMGGMGQGGIYSGRLPGAAPSGSGDIGPGIPVSPEQLNPGAAVTSTDLGGSGIEAAMRALGSMGGKGGGFKMPAPTPSAPRRQVGSRPEFIYTNPAAAQQAASNYAARLGAETGQERGYQDYAGRISESQAANDRARIQGENQAQQVQFAGQEGAANRASAERIAGTGEAVRQQRIAEATWAENERAAEMGEQTAGMLNADPNAKVDRKFAYLNPATGKWESRFKRQPRPTPPGQPGMATPVPAPGVAPAPSIAVPQAAVAPPVAAGSPAVPAEPVSGGSPSMLSRIGEVLGPAAVGAINPLAGEAYRQYLRR